MLHFSNHAVQRLCERGISQDQIAAALAGRTRTQLDGNTMHYDPTTHCTLVINPAKREIVTCYIMRANQAKRFFGRGRG